MIFEVLWPRAGSVPECSYSVPGTSGAWVGETPHRGDEVRHEAQLVFQLQDPHTALVYQILGNFSFFHQTAQVVAVDSCHHVNIYACFHCTHCCFFSVCTISVINGLLDGCPV